jgi:hypothetical protein
LPSLDGRDRVRSCSVAALNFYKSLAIPAAREAKFAEQNQMGWRIQVLAAKISRLQFSGETQSLMYPASLAEGRIAVVTRREAGMRWTRTR